jgi:hypothetical protein
MDDAASHMHVESPVQAASVVYFALHELTQVPLAQKHMLSDEQLLCADTGKSMYRAHDFWQVAVDASHLHCLSLLHAMELSP